jgi:type IV secretion system protein VirB11
MFLDDPEVTEIVIQSIGDVGVERNGTWRWYERDDLDFDHLDGIGILAGYMLAKDFDPAHPICMTTLPDGQRCTLIRPPVTPRGTISITIRIPSRAVHTVHDADFPDLMQAAAQRLGQRSATDADLATLYRAKDWPAFFSLAVRSRKTIVATGAVGSGKTTFLKRLMQEIPLHERIVTIEDTDEFGVLPQRNRVSLFYGSANVTAEDAVAASLRMRPDRIMMQELRGPEAFAYLRALASGHPGGQTTWHAEDGDPWTPLALMVKTSEAGSTIPDDKLDQIMRAFIDIVVFCKRDEHGFSVQSVYLRGETP